MTTNKPTSMFRAVAWPKYAGGQCLLSKYQVAISVLLLGIINLKKHKNWKSQGGQLPPLPPPPAGYGPDVKGSFRGNQQTNIYVKGSFRDNQQTNIYGTGSFPGNQQTNIYVKGSFRDNQQTNIYVKGSFRISLFTSLAIFMR